MPFRNEGAEFGNTVESIFQTADSLNDIELILINDGSDDNLNYELVHDIMNKIGNYHINKNPLGVPACRDLGVSLAKYDNLLFIDSHMRFSKGWQTKIDSEFNYDTLFCSCAVNIGYGKYDLTKFVLSETDNLKKIYGADLHLFITKKDKFKDRILDFKNNFEKGKEINCVIGAFYGIKKGYYNLLKGFEGLKSWGSAEPYLSLKVLLSGGQIKCLSDVEIGHIYRDKPTYSKHFLWEIYNKFAMAYLFYDEKVFLKVIEPLKTAPSYKFAYSVFKLEKPKLTELKLYLNRIFVKSINDIL